jgi:DUF1680 family protein
MDYWNHRQFLLHGDAKHVDIMERTLYNGLISGVSLKGDTFFYPNPLESNGQHARRVVRRRVLPRQHHALHGLGARLHLREADDTLFVNLFAAGTADVDLAGGKLKLRRRRATRGRRGPDRADPGETARLHGERPHPGWAREEPVPGDLYRFADTPSAKPT